MTTSPAEGQIGESRKTGANRCIPMHDSLDLLLGRADRNLEKRKTEAHRELAMVNYASRSPTNAYLIRRGEGLVVRSHDERLYLKSARSTRTTWITWDNRAVEREDPRHPLFDRITKIMRVNHLTLTRHVDGSWFVKCDCGRREDVGVPCGCFFRIAENAGIPMDDIIHLCMVSPRHLKVWQTHYATKTRMGDLLYEAQEQAFRDKKKGMRVPDNIAQQLLRAPSSQQFRSPDYGPDTFPSHYQEAKYMDTLPACTRADVITYRKNKRKSTLSSPEPKRRSVCARTDTTTPPRIGTTLLDSDVQMFGSRSDGAQTLIGNLEESLLATPTQRAEGSLRTKDQQRTYTDISKMFEQARLSCLEDYVQLTRHRDLTKDTSDDYKSKVMERLTKLQRQLKQDSLDAALAYDSARGNATDSHAGALKFSGEEIPSHFSPQANVRRRGPCG